MIAHSIDWSTGFGAFAALTGVVSCSAIAFANRRVYPYCPRWLMLAYRVTWLVTAVAWVARGGAMLLRLDNSSLGFAPSVVLFTGVLLGLYLMVQLRRCWPFADR